MWYPNHLLVQPGQGPLQTNVVYPTFGYVLAHPPTCDAVRKFVLNSSVFELIKTTLIVELTDPNLLAWYLALPLEDRRLIQEEGGFQTFLQNHPALAVSGRLVYVKDRTSSLLTPQAQNMSSDLNKSRRPKFYSLSQCQKCGTNTHFNSERCKRCISLFGEAKAEIDTSGDKMFSQILEDEGQISNSDMKANAGLASGQLSIVYSSNSTAQNPTPQWYNSCANEAQPNAHGSHGDHAYQLWENQAGRGQSNPKSLSSSDQANFSLDEQLEVCSKALSAAMENSEDEGANADSSEMENLTEYYSFISTEKKPELTGETGVVGGGDVKGPAENAEQRGAEEDVLNPRVIDELSWLDDSLSEESCLSLNEASFTSALQEEASSCVKCQHAGSRVMVDQLVDASGDFRASFTESRAVEVKVHTVCTAANTSKSQSRWRDVGVNTHQHLWNRPNLDQSVQTVETTTTDKSIITDIHVADLEYLAEEFVRLSHAEAQLTDKLRRCAGDPQCDCFQRAVRAELRLLALQYKMCQQHCWRIYHAFLQDQQGMEEPSRMLQEVLQDLEQQYLEKKEKILSGLPLEKLRPLCVETHRISSKGLYIPAQIIVDLDDLPAGLAENSCCRRDGFAGQRSESMREDKSEEEENTQRYCSAMPGLPSGEKNKGTTKELNSSEMWFDAKEDLQNVWESPQTAQKGSLNAEERDVTSVLCVTNIPTDVTEEEVVGWFGKYQAFNVRLTSVKDSRVAMVTLSGARNTETAIAELHGQTFRGCKIKVEKLRGSSAKLLNLSEDEIQAPPTIPVCIPQHYATMGSFDTLMVWLSERHPHISKNKIVDALLELRAQHHGLVGMPLKTIMEMTSDILRKK